MIIRHYTRQDVDALVPLFDDLGYSTDAVTLSKRLDFLFEDPAYDMFVAELDGVLVGMCGYACMRTFEVDGSYVRVLSFATHHKYRHQGIAQTLMQAMLDWAKENGHSALVLSSGIKESRYVAHTFYERFGFDKKSYGFSYTIK